MSMPAPVGSGDWGADVNAACSSGNTPLHFACSSGRAGLVRILIEAGALIHATNLQGETPSNLAETFAPDSDVMQMLVQLQDIERATVPALGRAYSAKI